MQAYYLDMHKIFFWCLNQKYKIIITDRPQGAQEFFQNFQKLLLKKKIYIIELSTWKYKKLHKSKNFFQK